MITDPMTEVLYYEGIVKSKFAQIAEIRKIADSDLKKEALLNEMIKTRSIMGRYSKASKVVYFRNQKKPSPTRYVKKQPQEPIIEKEKPKTNDIILPIQEVVTTTEESPRERLLRMKAEREKVNND